MKIIKSKDIEKKLDLYIDLLTKDQLKKALKELIKYSYESEDINIILDDKKQVVVYWESCGEPLIEKET
jgi:hypothetical protein